MHIPNPTNVTQHASKQITHQIALMIVIRNKYQRLNQICDFMIAFYIECLQIHSQASCHRHVFVCYYQSTD